MLFPEIKLSQKFSNLQFLPALSVTLFAYSLSLFLQRYMPPKAPNTMPRNAKMPTHSPIIPPVDIRSLTPQKPETNK